MLTDSIFFLKASLRQTVLVSPIFNGNICAKIVEGTNAMFFRSGKEVLNVSTQLDEFNQHSTFFMSQKKLSGTVGEKKNFKHKKG